MAHLYMFNQ